MQFYEKYLDISPEVRDALLYRKPVVALDSTTLCHGIPYPQNIDTVIATEEIIRSNGAIPVTIAILNGRLKVGLTREEMEYLGKSQKKIIRATKRDIPFLISKKLDGATTVASTITIASLAGINIFATGGIGGVHRNAYKNFDVSSDLEELSSTNVVVVCSGPTLILDTGHTLQHLETHGVPVIGYQTNELAGFYTRSSKFKVDYRVENPTDIAEALKIKWELGLSGGVVVSNPIPSEFSIEYDFISKVVDTALEEAEQKNINGIFLTPFLLERIHDLTEGRSLNSNIQLIYSNAKLASQIAISYHNMV